MRTTLSIVGVSVLALLVLAIAACSDTGTRTQSPDPTDPATYAEGQAYTVRGVIVQLPDAGPPPKDLKIHHEHIPDFVGKSGEIHINPKDGVPGMKAMVMAFPNLAPSVSLDGLAVDDKVEFEFLVRWEENAAGQRSATWLVNRLT